MTIEVLMNVPIYLLINHHQLVIICVLLKTIQKNPYSFVQSI